MRRPGPTSTAPRTTRRRRRPSTSAARSTRPSSACRSSYFSTDYVFDGRKAEPYVESDSPNPLSVVRAHEAPRRGGGGRAGLDRPHLVALRRDGAQLRAHDAPARRRARRGGGGGRPARLADLRRGTSPRRCASSSRCRSASGTSRPAGRRPGPSSPRRSSRRRGSRAACGGSRRRSCGRPAPRPANSVLRSEKPGAPVLPHWREGLRACLERLG